MTLPTHTSFTTTLPATNRVPLRRAALCAVIAASALLGACSSSRQTYVHSDNGTGGASSGDALGQAIGSRLNAQRRMSRVNAADPLFFTAVPADSGEILRSQR
jgi:hypothetical protein